MKRLTLILFLSLFANSVWAATEYLNTSCAINGNGTAEACAATPGGAGAWNAGASVTYNAADIINIARGTTVTDLPTSVSSQVTLQAYGTGADPIISKNGTTFTLSISAADVTLNDLAVRGNQSSAVISTIGARTTINRGSVYNNTTTNGIGIRFNNASSDGAVNGTVIYDINDDGIGISATATGTFTLTNIVCYEIDKGASNGDCIQAYDGTAANVTVSGGNFTKENGIKQAIRYSGSGTLRVINGAVISAPVSGAQGISMEGSGILQVERAYIIGSDGAPAIFATNTGASYVRSSIIDGGEEGIWSSHASGTLDVFNNTIKGAFVAGIYHTTGGTLTAKNNFIDAPVNIYDASAGATTVADYNRYGSGTFRIDGAAGVALAAWQSTTSQDANSAVAAPRFLGGSSPTTADGFRPLPSSPLLGTGSPLGAKYDYEGYRFGNPPNIGAFVNNGPNSYSRRSNYDRRTTFPERY
jgi:hypothetical protein